MTKQPSKEGTEPGGSWEESVRRFLEQTPDYFLRHPELLAALALPHPDTGRVVSLVERQVRVMRDRNEQLTRELHDLVQIARDNDQLGERVQRFALAVIEASGLDDLLDTAQDMLRQEFGLDGVALRLTGQPRPPGQRSEFVADEDPVLDSLLMQLSARNQQPWCGPPSDPEVLTALFGTSASRIRSIAIIELAHRGLRGALVLGSEDAKRFRADIGTQYLARLGALFRVGIVRHLSAAE